MIFQTLIPILLIAIFHESLLIFIANMPGEICTRMSQLETFFIDKAYPMLKTFAKIHYDALKGHLNVSKDYMCKLYKQTHDCVVELCLSAFDQEQRFQPREGFYVFKTKHIVAILLIAAVFAPLVVRAIARRMWNFAHAMFEAITTTIKGTHVDTSDESETSSLMSGSASAPTPAPNPPPVDTSDPVDDSEQVLEQAIAKQDVETLVGELELCKHQSNAMRKTLHLCHEREVSRQHQRN